MPENNVEIMETVNTTANEVIEAAKTAKFDTGSFMMFGGFIAGIGLAIGFGVARTRITKKRCDKAAKQFKESVETKTEE